MLACVDVRLERVVSVQFGAVLRFVKGDTGRGARPNGLEGWWAQCKDQGSCIELAELQIFVNDNGRVWSWRQLLAILQGACPAITEH